MAANGSRQRRAKTRAKPERHAVLKPGFPGRVGSRARRVRCHAAGNYHPGPAPATGSPPLPPKGGCDRAALRSESKNIGFAAAVTAAPERARQRGENDGEQSRTRAQITGKMRAVRRAR